MIGTKSTANPVTYKKAQILHMKLCILLLLNQILFPHTRKPPKYYMVWMWWLGPPLTPFTLLTNSFLRWAAVRNLCTWTKASLRLTQNNMELQFHATALCCRDQPSFLPSPAFGQQPCGQHPTVWAHIYKTITRNPLHHSILLTYISTAKFSGSFVCCLLHAQKSTQEIGISPRL